MSQELWIEKNSAKMRLFPEGWYFLCRSLEEFLILVADTEGDVGTYPMWIILALQIMTRKDDMHPKMAEMVLKQVKVMIEARLEKGEWCEVGDELHWPIR